MQLRLYTFINFYLSSIQQGIQSAHLVHDLMLKYQVHSSAAAKLVSDWAREHKTMIVLNGGTTAELEQGIEVMRAQSSYPWVEFYESRECLSGALTGFGVVLPESVYDCTKGYRANPTTFNGEELLFIRPTGEHVRYGDADFDIISLVKSKGLAK